MSFSFEQKKGIIASSYKSCCRRSLLRGVLFSKGCVDDGVSVSISLEKREIADYLSPLIREFFGKNTVPNTSPVGGRRVLLSFDSRSAAEYLAEASKSIDSFDAKCDLCGMSFLRGVFLASGRMSDPKKQYSIEFSLGSRSEIFDGYLKSLGVSSSVSHKNNESVVFIKNGEEIEEFCAHAGLNKALFAIIDARAEGELRKNVMRVANCETNNIAKAVDAAKGQLEVIRALEESNLLSSLPEELEATARLRLRYADLSLAQLSAVSVPPISKPGLSHRLKRIMEIGNNLLARKNN